MGGRANGALFEVGVEDDHHFICTQSGLHLLRTQAATAFPWQEGCAFRRAARDGRLRRTDGPTPAQVRRVEPIDAPGYQRARVARKSSSTGPARTALRLRRDRAGDQAEPVGGGF